MRSLHRLAHRVAPVLGVALALFAHSTSAEAQRTRPVARRSAADTVPPAPWERRSPVRFALGGGGVFQTALGGTGAQVNNGAGFDVFGALQVSALSLGVGYQRTSHALSSAGTGRAVYHGVFVEPRLSVAPYRNFTPYAVGRAAFLRQRVPASAQYAAQSRALTAIGAGVGTLVWLAPGVQLDLAGLYTDVRAGGSTATLGTFRGGTGAGATLRAGVVVGLENWGR